MCHPGLLPQLNRQLLTFSLVNFKRTCRSVYKCLAKNPCLEEGKWRSKLSADWASGTHRDVTVPVSGLVSCADFFTPDHTRLAVGVNDKVHICTIRDPPEVTVLPGSDSCITCVAVLNGLRAADCDSGYYAVASGSNDGKLMVWENGELKVTKQLFGRIEELKWVQASNYLISAHFGGGGRANGAGFLDSSVSAVAAKVLSHNVFSTDAGCISIRLVESLDQGATMPVVFSLFQDIFPVFCVDLSPPGTHDSYLATVEWSGTFNNVHDGLLNVYKGFKVRR